MKCIQKCPSEMPYCSSTAGHVTENDIFHTAPMCYMENAYWRVEQPKRDVQFTEMESQSEKFACGDPTWASLWQRALCAHAMMIHPGSKACWERRDEEKTGLNDFCFSNFLGGRRHRVLIDS